MFFIFSIHALHDVYYYDVPMYYEYDPATSHVKIQVGTNN